MVLSVFSKDRKIFLVSREFQTSLTASSDLDVSGSRLMSSNKSSRQHASMFVYEDLAVENAELLAMRSTILRFRRKQSRVPVKGCLCPVS